MTSFLHGLEPAGLWRIFSEICSIPHTSGNEKELGAYLAAKAEAHGLTVTADKAGNLRIDRPAFSGMEHRPHILLQAHLDMVGQSRNPGFNFQISPITPVQDGDYVKADGTTLGADNGIGIAAAMALLLDESFESGPLSLLTTVAEETGLAGASALDSSMLRCDILLNLDFEEEGVFCIGCAGGSSLDISLPLKKIKVADEGMSAVSLHIAGMKGGHSGIDIHRPYGNALRSMAEFLAGTECCISTLAGGSADNAIPGECTAAVTLPSLSKEVFVQKVRELKEHIRREFEVSPSFDVIVTDCSLPESVWDAAQQAEILDALLNTPSGVMEYSVRYHAVATSSNIASIRTAGNTLHITMSQRGFDDGRRAEVTGSVSRIFSRIGGESREYGVYPGWPPQTGGPAADKAEAVYREFSGKDAELKVIHAGLECGIFARKAPGLQMISFGPEIINPHSPDERVSIPSVQRFWKLLKKLVSAL